MITNVRLWNTTAIPRIVRRAKNAFRSTKVSTQEVRDSNHEKGFFEAYEKMMESQAILVLGLHDRHW